MLTSLLWGLFSRVAPGMAVGLLALVLIPRARMELRLTVYVMMFVLLRDAMTPLGLWNITVGGTVRFTSSPALLIDLGLLAFAAVFTINVFEPELARVLVWFKGKAHWAVLAGLVGAILVAGPVALVRHELMPDVMQPAVPLVGLGPLLVLSLLGNFLEEALFRGYFQGLVERVSGPLRAAFASGMFFAFCHSFLAITVTNLGVALLAFTWFEGTVAALIRMRFGLVASTLAHGLAIFLLASGLLDR